MIDQDFEETTYITLSQSNQRPFVVAGVTRFVTEIEVEGTTYIGVDVLAPTWEVAETWCTENGYKIVGIFEELVND